jgi:hypothetical protein
VDPPTLDGLLNDDGESVLYDFNLDTFAHDFLELENPIPVQHAFIAITYIYI